MVLKACASSPQRPCDCLGEALISGGEAGGLAQVKGEQDWVEGPLFCAPDVPMEEVLISAQADKSSLTDEPDDSGFILAHSENALITWRGRWGGAI